MFKEAKSLSAPKTAKVAKEKERIEFAGIKRLAHLDAVIKMAKSTKEQIESSLKEKIWDMFYDRANGNDASREGAAPSSFNGAEDNAECNLQLRKRSTMSALTEDELEILAKHNIKYEVETLSPRLFAINPDYAADEKLLEKVEKALLKAGVPADFIVVQDAIEKKVVSPETLTEALRSKDMEVIKTCTTLAFKYTLSEIRPAEIAETVKELMGLEDQEEKKPAKKVVALKPTQIEKTGKLGTALKAKAK